ncbi:MAG: penicillin-binding protein 2 [Rickettsiales bacterium]|jgi:penicillin-binding protein 2|nr:penicillin-binding protein 2 [Rickettsiales bacterium]
MLDKEIAATFDRRSALFLTGGAVLTGVLLLRMMQLQIFNYKKYHNLSQNNSTRIIIDPPVRGRILDRDGAVLARDDAIYRVFIIPNECDDVAVVLDAVRDELKLSDKEITKIQNKITRNRRFQPVILRDSIKWSQLVKLKALNIAGLYTEPGLARKYPGEGIAAHTVGYVGNDEDNRTVRMAITSPFIMSGIAGLEKIFNEKLSGTPGQIITHTDALGRVIDTNKEQRIAPTNGKNLQTTLRANVQKKMEEELSEHGAGCGVMIECATGDIIAIASAPSFDANIFRSLDGPEYMEELLKNKLKPFMNKSIEGLYPPGSTFKIVVALAALESGAITGKEKIYCDGDWEYGKHIYHCWEKKGHGWVDLEGALEHSCDIYFYQLALKIGINPIKSMAEKLGLGQKLLNLLPREMAGVIPNREWKKKNIRASWVHGDTIISGIGQGYILTNCLQLAVMGARAATGREIIPNLILDTSAPRPQTPDLGLNPKNIKIVMNGLRRVTGKNGTAYGAGLICPDMGGKTGTAQVRRISMAERKSGVKTNEQLAWEQRNHGLFVGLAPINNPKYAVAIITEHAGGSGIAARAAARVMKEALQ